MSTNTPGGPSRKEAREGRAARAAAEMEALRKKQQRKTLLSIVGVVVLIVAVLGVSIFIGQKQSDDTTVTAPTTSATGEGAGLTIGPANAPNKVVVFEDFLCPYCGMFEKSSRDGLAKLADQGKVRVEYRPFVLLSQAGPYSEDSAKVFAVVKKTADNDVAKKFHDLLYENQPSEQGPFPSTDDLVKLAAEAGADKTKVQQGVDNGDGDAWVKASNQAAQDAGVQGTPTILLNGTQFQKGNTMQEMAQYLLAELGS